MIQLIDESSLSPVCDPFSDQFSADSGRLTKARGNLQRLVGLEHHRLLEVGTIAHAEEGLKNNESNSTVTNCNGPTRSLTVGFFAGSCSDVAKRSIQVFLSTFSNLRPLDASPSMIVSHLASVLGLTMWYTAALGLEVLKTTSAMPLPAKSTGSQEGF